MAECAEMSAAQRLAAIAVAILAVVGIAVVGLSLADGDVAADPSPSAIGLARGVAGPSGAPTEEPSPADEDEVLAASPRSRSR